MSYDNIAEMVHDLVKNPKSMQARELGLCSAKPKSNEFTIIQRVFSEFEVSGDAMAIRTLPPIFWG